MERPYAIGGGLRQLVDFFQHHVAFTTHPDSVLAWELGRGAVPRRRASDCSVVRPLGQQPMSFQTQSAKTAVGCTDSANGAFTRACWPRWAGCCAGRPHTPRSTIRSMSIRPAGTSTLPIAKPASPHKDTWQRVVFRGGACETITFVASAWNGSTLGLPDRTGPSAGCLDGKRVGDERARRSQNRFASSLSLPS